MKNINWVIACLIVALGASCQSDQSSKEKGNTTSQTTISGTLEGYQDTVYVVVPKEFVTYTDSVINKIVADENGSFSLSFQQNKPQYFILVAGGKRRSFFAHSGDQIKVKSKISLLDLRARFSGNRAAENNFLTKKDYLKANQQMNFLPNKIEAAEQTVEVIENASNLLLNFHSEYFKKNESDSTFVKKELRKINYWIVNQKFSIPELIKIKFNLDSLNLGKNFYGFANKIQFDTSDLDQDIMLSAADQYCTYQVYKKANDPIVIASPPVFLRNYFHQSSVLFEYKLYTILQTRAIVSRLASGLINQESALLLNLYYDSVKNPSYNKIVENVFNKVTGYDQIINFSLPDASGNIFESDSLRGKLVLIDFWATWCKPCLQQQPFFNVLAEEYSDKEIVFLGICLDKNEDKWKALLEKKQAKGIQIIDKKATGSELAKSFRINSIPRFSLLDRDGKIISLSAPLPSQTDLIRNLINASL